MNRERNRGSLRSHPKTTRFMKLALLLHVLLGETSAFCPRIQSGSGAHESTTIAEFDDTSCDTETGIGGISQTAAEWAADMGSDCTPKHGECFPWSTACESTLAALCNRQPGSWPDGHAPKAVKIWWTEQGGRPVTVCGTPCIAGIAASAGFLVLCVIGWLANLFNRSSCGEPPCPSPLPMFKPKAEAV